MMAQPSGSNTLSRTIRRSCASRYDTLGVRVAVRVRVSELCASGHATLRVRVGVRVSVRVMASGEWRVASSNG